MKQPEDKGTGCFTKIALFLLVPLAVVGLVWYILREAEINLVACFGAFLIVAWVGLLVWKPKGLSQDTEKLRLDGGRK